MSAVDASGLKTSFTIYASGAQVIGGFWGGTAIAKTDCVNGKSYKAYYAVVGTGLGLSAGLNAKGVKDAAKTALSQIDNFTTPPSFSTQDNYPPSYVSYLDTEAFTVDWGFGGYRVVDLEFSPYEGGRDKPTDPLNNLEKNPTYELQAGLFNIVAWNLFRTGVETTCCDK